MSAAAVASEPSGARLPAPPDERELLTSNSGELALSSELLATVLRPPSWLGPATAVTGVFSLVLLVAVVYTLVTGIGVWGNNIPVAWGFAITNFVWWIGIGHAGTFISAIFYLMHQEWRTSINRFAEAMTLFAVACAGLMPLLHLGRPWFFYWLLPYPD